MTRSTFTFGQTPEDTILAALPHKFSMELTRGDMLAVLEALAYIFDSREEDEIPDEIRERAASLRSGILETIGIEEI